MNVMIIRLLFFINTLKDEKKKIFHKERLFYLQQLRSETGTKVTVESIKISEVLTELQETQKVATNQTFPTLWSIFRKRETTLKQFWHPITQQDLETLFVLFLLCSIHDLHLQFRSFLYLLNLILFMWFHFYFLFFLSNFTAIIFFFA
jgi:hypothetical protein